MTRFTNGPDVADRAGLFFSGNTRFNALSGPCNLQAIRVVEAVQRLSLPPTGNSPLLIRSRIVSRICTYEGMPLIRASSGIDAVPFGSSSVKFALSHVHT